MVDGIIIKDNFLDDDVFNSYAELMQNNTFAWYYNPLCSMMDDNGMYQFVHNCYDDYKSMSGIHDALVMPILSMLKARSIIRAKINLQPRHHEIVEAGMHTDFPCSENDYYKHRTCILYMNTNNGYTRFESGEKVESVANRLVDFPSHLMHTKSTHTDAKVRIVLNINYVPQ